MRGYTPPVLPEEETIIYGDDGTTPLTILQEYLFNLIRRSMNRKTGIAGDKSRISWGGLYERAYEDPRQGYSGTGDAWGKTRDKRILYIRNQVRRIEKLGLIKLVSNKGGSLQIEFVIFNKYRSLYFSDQNKVTSNLPLEVTTNLPPETTNNNNELAKDEQREVTTPESAKVTTYPEVSRYTGSSSKYSSNLIDISNNHANNSLTDLQNQYWTAIQQTHVFSIQVLTRPDRQAEYQRMLALWESQGVDPGRLPDALKTILDDLTSRNSKAYSPMYFEQPVLRLIGANHAASQSSHSNGGYRGKSGTEIVMEQCAESGIYL